MSALSASDVPAMPASQDPVNEMWDIASKVRSSHASGCVPRSCGLLEAGTPRASPI